MVYDLTEDDNGTYLWCIDCAGQVRDTSATHSTGEQLYAFCWYGSALDETADPLAAIKRGREFHERAWHDCSLTRDVAE
jgi:hypothetical protein